MRIEQVKSNVIKCVLCMFCAFIVVARSAGSGAIAGGRPYCPFAKSYNSASPSPFPCCMYSVYLMQLIVRMYNTFYVVCI